MEKMFTVTMCRCLVLKFKSTNIKKSDWITSGLIKSIRFRDNLYKYMKKTPRHLAGFWDIKQNLIVYNRILKRSIRETKRNHYNNKFDQCKGDSKKTWNIINNVINEQQKVFLPI